MATKTQTKSEIRNNTAKIGKLLRGIDNETLAIRKDQDKLSARVKTVQENTKAVHTLIGGISNAALTAPAPAKSNGLPAKKPAVKAQPKTAKIAAKGIKTKLTAKAAKPKAVAKTAKPKAAAKLAKVQAKPEKTPPASDRPSFKQVITEILAVKEPQGAAEIYKAACQKHGYWSRQSLYNALKDAKSFSKNGEGYSRVQGSTKSTATSDSEADEFVSKVAENTATANVV
jgi:hypothetical protein